MAFLCDTNVLSELIRPTPHLGVVAWARRVHVICLSAIVVDEICFALGRHPNQRVQDWFDTFLDQHCEVLPVTDTIARRAGALRARLHARGVTRTQADMTVVATAQEHNLTLVTRDVRDFDGCGVALLDPFV